MATESFYQDMVIDTPEAEANLLELLESGTRLKRGNTVFRWATPEFLDLVHEKYTKKQRCLEHRGRDR